MPRGPGKFADGPETVSDSREIIFPHVGEPKPVTAVKNSMLQSSVAQLHALGVYEQYASIVTRGVPEQIAAELPISWVPIDLALAHYRACDDMVLQAEQRTSIAARVGDRLRETMHVTGPKKDVIDGDLWAHLGPLHRMWGRQYQGGSVQVVKAGPKECLLEMSGFRLVQYKYFRQGLLVVIAGSYESVGVRVSSTRIVSHSATRDELVIRITWL